MVRRRPDATDRCVHVHIENSRGSASVFRVTPEMFAAAAARHADLASQVKVSIGDDLQTFDAAMETAEVLVGWRFRSAICVRGRLGSGGSISRERASSTCCRSTGYLETSS